MSDISARDLERVKFAFSIYDFDGNNTMDAFYVPDLLRALNLNPTNAVLEKMGLIVKRKQKKIKLEEFTPVFSTIKKDKDAGSYEDFIEVLKLYDKAENGTMIFAELEHILITLGEKIEKSDLDPILKETVDEEDDEGCVPYAPFLKKICAPV